MTGTPRTTLTFKIGSHALGRAVSAAFMLTLALSAPALAQDAAGGQPVSAASASTAPSGAFSGTAGSAYQVPASVSAASAPLPTGVDYRIHGGDALGIAVFGDPALSQTTTVLPDGSINYPLIGRVNLRGLTTLEASSRIASSLSAYVRHPHVSVSVQNPAQFTVLVLGNVKAPGRYLIRSDARVSDAIATAGGLGTTNGVLPTARISLGTQVVRQVSLQELFHDGDTSQNVPLADGSTVYVPSPITFDVEVVGAVDHPGNVSINEGDHLSMAIAKAGNSPNSSADLNHIHVTRKLADGTSQSFEINLYQTLEHGDLSVDVPLRKNDVVFVPESRGNHGLKAGTSGAFFLISRLAGIPVY